MKNKNPLIVGIDPGNTSAVAALNLDKEVELLHSERDLSDSNLIKQLIDTGTPVVITSDKKDMPSKAEKIARSLGAMKFNPEKDLSRSKKKELGFGDNSHEKDAMASAINAYNHLERKIKKLKNRSKDIEMSEEELATKYFSGDLEQEKIKK